MQYILTQAEYDALTPVKRLQERNEALEVAREIIVRLNESRTGMKCGVDYCDTCPISDIGHAKDGSMEDRPSHKESKHICIKERYYSR
jgi:hypothetical protein